MSAKGNSYAHPHYRCNSCLLLTVTSCVIVVRTHWFTRPVTTAYAHGRLRVARTEVELTQAQVAERMGVTQTAVSYWESGERQIGLDELLDFAVATNQPVEFFLSSPEPPQTGIPALDERDELREAAMWVVLNWDAERTQHGSMPALRQALGLPGERPTREEAERRINEYIGVEVTP